jgi:hypothetical protein
MLEEVLTGLVSALLLGALVPIVELVGSMLSELLLELLEDADAA